MEQEMDDFDVKAVQDRKTIEHLKVLNQQQYILLQEKMKRIAEREQRKLMKKREANERKLMKEEEDLKRVYDRRMADTANFE